MQSNTESAVLNQPSVNDYSAMASNILPLFSIIVQFCIVYANYPAFTTAMAFAMLKCFQAKTSK